MARYNHFKPHKYKTILFSSLAIGDKFRIGDYAGKGGRRRYNIICIKTGELSWIEQHSKKVCKIFFDKGYEVQDYSDLNEVLLEGR